MTSTLPARPDIAQLRRQAKELQRSARAGQAAALGRLAAVTADPQRANLSAAQLAVAREYGFASWPALRAAVADATPTAGMHVARSVFANKDLSEPSLFTADRFLSLAHDAGWQPGPLPDAVVFTFSGIFAHVLRDDPRFEPNLLLAPGNSEMFNTIDDNPRIAVTCLSPGATAMIGQVENQVALGGADRFVIVGTAGAIHPDVHPGDVIVVDHAVRDDGVSSHYLPPDTYVDAHPGLSAALLESLDQHGIAATYGSTWTVPTPYRSTATQVRQLADDGVAVVECEVASLLAVAEALGVRAAACLYVTGSITDRTRTAPSEPLRPLEVFEAALAALRNTP